MIKALAVVLVILLYIVGGNRGIITFKSLFFNIAVLSLSILLMTYGWDPVIVTFISSLIICYITLFYQNGKNSKTIASFFSVVVVLLVLFSLSYYVGYEAHLGGIDEIIRYEDEIDMLSHDININMSKIAVAMIITGLIGAAIDASIAIASAVYEVYKNNRCLNLMELFKSGINIGSDILGASVNTLFFACLGESLSMFALLKIYKYSILDLINSKAFCQEFINIIISCIACILVIPLTAIIVSYILKNPNKFEKHLLKDELFLDFNKEK
ncbi:YibE/F family protein [Anaerovorax odorimutans]|uniref:YibE/F family protein n=1 Tax=Anaerovorax odorimutans TaxID=109327 RepID=UPI0004073AF7|nr:YibE/F family protein [Anaerovorax odorimutans]